MLFLLFVCKYLAFCLSFHCFRNCIYAEFFNHEEMENAHTLFLEKCFIMGISNRNFNIPTPPPPSRAKPGHLTIFCARGEGNLTFACVGWGKLNRKGEVSNIVFSGAEVAHSCKTRVWTRWKSLKKRCSICERSAYKKGLQKVFIKDGRSRRRLFS